MIYYSQKHLQMYLDEALNVSHHIKEKMSKAMEELGIFK